MACLGDESVTPKGAEEDIVEPNDITPDILTLLVAMKENMDQNNAMLATLMSECHKRPLPYDDPDRNLNASFERLRNESENAMVASLNATLMAAQTAPEPTAQTASFSAAQTARVPAAQTATPLAAQTATPLAAQTATPVAAQTATPLAAQTATPLAAWTATPLAAQTATPLAAQSASFLN